MTTNDCLITASQKLESIDSGNFISNRLLSEVIGKPLEYIYAHPEAQVPESDYQRYMAFVNRAARHEPLAYLLGYKEFYGRRFEVTPDTLIPRPETEGLVGAALRHCEELSEVAISSPTIVDVGSGSGAIGLTLAKELPHSTVYATDVSEKALDVARNNARLLDVSNVVFMQGSLLEPLAGCLEPNSVAVVVANLPYISNSEYDALPPEVRDYEPALALRSESDDPDALNTLLVEQSNHWLKTDGLLLYETTNGRLVASR